MSSCQHCECLGGTLYKPFELGCRNQSSRDGILSEYENPRELLIKIVSKNYWIKNDVWFGLGWIGSSRCYAKVFPT